MADTDWTNEELASLDRIPRYNVLDPANGGDAYSFGGDGYLDNQMRQQVDGLVVTRAARRLALSASSQAVTAAQEAANAKAERVAAQNAASDAYASAGSSAAQVPLAKAQADRAKSEADRAFGLAQSFNLPAITADMAGRFLRVNAGGTAWELGEITVATAAQLNAGSGKGFANAETLGPILKAQKDAIPEVGSFLARAKWSPDPNGNWLPANGQLVPLASYPALADVLPPIEDQYLGLYPLERSGSQVFGAVSNGSGANSDLRSVGYKDNVVVTVQRDVVRYLELATGISRMGTITGTAAGAGTDSGRPLAVRDGEVVGLNGNGNQPVHISTLAGTIGQSVAGAINSYSNAGRFLVQLGNGVVLVIQNTTADPNNFQVIRLRPSENSTQWSVFNPPGGFISSNFFVFKDLQGRVYLVSKTAGSTGDYTIFRTTDGETWTAVGSGVVHNAESVNIDVGEASSGNPIQAPRRRVYISSDGSKILYFPNGSPRLFYTSTDGGSSWTRRGLSSVGFPTLPTGTDAISVYYDKIRDRFLFCVISTSTVNGYSMLRITIRETANFTSYSATADTVTNIDTGGVTPTSLGIVSERDSMFVFTNRGYFLCPTTVAGIVTIPASPTLTSFYAPLLVYENYPFDGVVMLLQGDNGSYTIVWAGRGYKGDLVYVFRQIPNRSSSTPYSFPWVSPDKKLVATFVASQFMAGPIFSYNPAVERRIPKVVHNLPSGATLPLYEEYQVGNQTAFNWYMRAK